MTPDQDVHDAISALQSITQSFQDRREQLAQSVGLTVAQWQVLEEISTEHFMPSMFAQSRQSSAAAVSKILRQLIDEGLIAVAVSRGDGRKRDYTLTARGQRTMRELRAQREHAIREVWQDLDRGELRSFARFSRTLAERLQKYMRKRGSHGQESVRESV